MAAAILGVAAALSGGCGGADDQISSTPGSTSAPAPRHTVAPVKVSENLAAVCPQLARRTRALIDGIASRPPGRLTIHPTRSLHLTACRLDADDAEAHLTLDVAPDARQRYSNRMVESYQFGSGAGATSPGLRPRPVKGVGDPKVEGGGANWLPIYNQLLSVRGPRVLIVGMFVKGAADRELRAAATRLSRWAYSLLGGNG
jgi:hypothetical protein